ncbi:MAG: nucleoside deaminase [Bryobacteraceae bacterium]
MPRTAPEAGGAAGVEFFLRRAIELAAENVRSGRGGPFGAVIVRQGRIVAEGVNLVTSELDPTAHAEITAIRRACAGLGRFHLNGCEIYSSCEPCPMCLGAIYWARLDRIWYSATRADAAAAGFQDEQLYHEISVPVSRRSIPMVQLLREEALPALEAWRSSATRIDY